MCADEQKIIPAKYIPEVGSRIEEIDGRRYLIANDAMYTFYQRSKGELSPFFLALREEKRLLGCRCAKCGLVRVPPFLTHCPDSGSARMWSSIPFSNWTEWQGRLQGPKRMKKPPDLLGNNGEWAENRAGSRRGNRRCST